MSGCRTRITVTVARLHPLTPWRGNILSRAISPLPWDERVCVRASEKRVDFVRAAFCVKISPCPSMDKSDTDALRNAVQLLEHPSLAARLANMIGKPVELLGRALPAGASQAIAQPQQKASKLPSRLRSSQFEVGLKQALRCCTELWQLPRVPLEGRLEFCHCLWNFPSRPSSSCDQFSTSREARARTSLIPNQACRALKSLDWAVGQRPMMLRRVAISLCVGFLRLPSRKLPASLLNAASLRKVALCSCG